MDHSAFTFQQVGGVSRYAAEPASRIPGVRVVCIASQNQYLHGLVRSGRVRSVPWPPAAEPSRRLEFPGRVRLERLINRGFSAAWLTVGHANLIHAPSSDPYMIGFLRTRPLVLTIHDMMHELFPELHVRSERVSEWKRRLLSRADHVIAVSARTRADLLGLYPQMAGRVTVTHLGSSLVDVVPSIRHPVTRTCRGTKRTITDDGYILFVGARRSVKNFPRLASAVAEVLRSRNDLMLVCAGQDFNRAEGRMLEQLGIADRVTQLQASDSQLKRLLIHARCMVYPSVYEGFGLPIVEAFSCGTPVVTSRAGSLPEVAAEAAHYCNPYDVASIRDALVAVVDSRGFRQELSERGTQRARAFSWDRCAAETQAVYARFADR